MKRIITLSTKNNLQGTNFLILYYLLISSLFLVYCNDIRIKFYGKTLSSF